MLFKQYPAFPSDTNLVLAAAGARVTLAYIGSGLTAEYSVEEVRDTAWRGVVLFWIVLLCFVSVVCGL